MSTSVFNSLASQSISTEKVVQAEQKLIMSLSQFSEIIQTKSERELQDIKLKVLLIYKDHCTDSDVVWLCLHMIQLIHQQIKKLGTK